MKHIITFLAFSLFSTLSFSQILNPVSWDFTAEKAGNGEFVLIFTATVEPGWVIYSQFLDSDEGPVATEFNFENLNGAELIGKNEEHGKMKEEYDKIFEMTLKKLSGKIEFKQKLKGKSGSNVAGYLTYMTCDNARCLPPTDVDFDITLP